MRAILFDWDGTIVDSIDRLFDAYAVVSRQYGLAFDREIFGRVFAPDWRLMYRQMGMPEEQIKQAGHAWVAAFQGELVEPFPGVRDRLERLVSTGYRLGLVTGGHEEIIAPQLERHGLARAFSVRVFGNELAVGKPDPAPLRLALERLGGEPTAAAYVGDALDDMRMAAAAGVRGVGISSLLADAAALRQAGAQEVAGSVVEWVDRLLASTAEPV